MAREGTRGLQWRERGLYGFVQSGGWGGCNAERGDYMALFMGAFSVQVGEGWGTSG